MNTRLRNFYLLLLCTSLFVGLAPALSQEGNYTFENYGNQSVLLNGNVTGSASDLGLTYYNPARLALIEKPSFVISGKAYQLDNYTLTDVFESEVDLSTSKFNGIPSIVAGTFSLKFLPKHKFAYAILSRYRSDIGINYSSGVQQGSEFFPFDDELPFRSRNEPNASSSNLMSSCNIATRLLLKSNLMALMTSSFVSSSRS